MNRDLPIIREEEWKIIEAVREGSNSASEGMSLLSRVYNILSGVVNSGGSYADLLYSDSKGRDM